MKFLRRPIVNAILILSVTVLYILIFTFISGHIEFLRLLNHSQTLSSPFWNRWSEFLANGNLKYIGYGYLALCLCIVVLTCLRKRNFDEYQVSILEKGFFFAGLFMVLLFLVAVFLILSDPNYAVETVLLLAASHWTIVLIAELVYLIQTTRA